MILYPSRIARKHAAIFCLLFLILCPLMSQTPYIYDTCKIIKGYGLAQSVKADIKFYNENGNSHLLYYTEKKSKPVIYSFKENTPLKSKTVNIKALAGDPINKKQVLGFCIRGNQLAVSQWSGISIFSRKGSSYIPVSSIALSRTSEYICINDQSIIMGNFYNYHPADSKHKFFFRKMDFSGKVTDTLIFHVPYPELLVYSPKHLITYAPGCIYAVQPSPFRIYAISYDLKQVDSFDIDAGHAWHNIPDDYHALFSQSFAAGDFAYYPLLDSFANKSVNRIEEIQFVQDSLLLCRELFYNDTARNGKGCSERYIHIINPLTKKLLHTYKQTSCFFNGNNTLDRTQFPIWTSMSYPVFYGNSTMIELHYASPYTPLNTTFKTYYYRNEAWLKRHKPVLNMWTYNYTF